MGNGTQKPADTLNIKGIQSQFGKQVLDGSGRNVLLPVENGYEYLSGIVVDVIDNPRTYFADANRRNALSSTLSIDDRSFNMIKKAPNNSTICQIIDLGQNEYSSSQIICFPFFPPHISLPIKPGEHVWILKEVTGDISRYYWMCRKHSAYHVENLNLNIHEREIEIYNTIEEFGRQKTQIEESVARLNNFDFPNFAQSGIGIPSLDKERIFKNSLALKKLTTEPVPALAKNCGDLLLQGSNNTAIHLTQEKFSQDINKLKERYPPETFAASEENIADRLPFSPAIDICVARKKQELNIARSLIDIRNTEEELEQLDPNALSMGPVNVETEGMHFIKNNHKDPNMETYEINKMPGFIKDLEPYNIKQDYDIDIKNCGARIYLSNNCDIDNVFNVGSAPKAEETIFKRYGGAIFSAYSEHTRFISDGTFRVVNSFETEEKSGSTYIEIDDTGRVSIGSLKGDVGSEGGVSGMQPFVKGSELEALLQRLIDEINALIDTLDNKFKMNSSPGLGGPNLILSSIIPMHLPPHKTNFDGIREDLNKFKSTLIRGE